jgi:thiamine-phosphate pyrophosphorylase
LNNLKDIDFYFITDSELSKNGIFSDVENAIKAGCRIIQYREKNKSTKEMIEDGNQLRKICNGRAVLLIDDRIDIALAIDADGVHIGQEDMPYHSVKKLLGKDKIIGLTVHNLEEALEAERLGVNYIGLAPIFKTGTKEDARNPIGPEMIRLVKEKVKLPLVAVGGIKRENIKDVIEAGADSIVSIYAILKADSLYDEVSEFIKIIKESKSK